MDDLNGVRDPELLLKVDQTGAQAELRNLALNETEGTPLPGKDKILF
jgi:hypothetical protein